MVDLKIHWIVDRLTKLVICLLFLDVACLCSFTISCRSFVPTLSYTSTFSVHDGLFVLIAGIQAIVVFLTVFSFRVTKETKYSIDDNLYSTALEIGIIVLLFCVSIVDESNGLEFADSAKFHKFFTINLCYFTFLWVFWALLKLRDIKKTLDQEFNLLVCWASLATLSILVLICSAQWAFAVSIYSNWFLNTYMEGIFEWLAILVAVRLPYHLTKVCDCDIKIVKAEIPS